MAELGRSGMTQVDFAKRRGVPPSTLRYWIYKLRGKREGGGSAQSVELVPVRVSPSAARQFEAQVAGIRLRFEVGTEPDYVAAVLNGLTELC